jgi:hypothetical protein
MSKWLESVYDVDEDLEERERQGWDKQWGYRILLVYIVLCLKPSFRTANGRLHVLFFKKSRIFWWLINYEHLNDFKNIYIKYRVK